MAKARFQIEEGRRTILLEDKILVKPVKQEEEKIGNIIVPELPGENSKENSLAEVIMLPIETKDHKMYVRVGDHVVINKYGGIDIVLQGEECKVVRQSDLVAIFRKQ